MIEAVMIVGYFREKEASRWTNPSLMPRDEPSD